MWDGGRQHAMDDDEKMDEDKEETDNEEIGDAEQEEEHQEARAMASPNIPSRREVEDHNLTHIPFRSWCRGRGRRSAHKRRHSEGEGADNRAVTACSIEYKNLTEEGREDEVDAEEGAARGRGDRSSWAWTGRPEEYTHTK